MKWIFVVFVGFLSVTTLAGTPINFTAVASDSSFADSGCGIFASLIPPSETYDSLVVFEVIGGNQQNIINFGRVQAGSEHPFTWNGPSIGLHTLFCVGYYKGQVGCATSDTFRSYGKGRGKLKR